MWLVMTEYGKLALLLLCVSIAAPLATRTDNASISGQFKGATGAVIPSATCATISVQAAKLTWCATLRQMPKTLTSLRTQTSRHLRI